jgi:hypothetical protein
MLANPLPAFLDQRDGIRQVPSISIRRQEPERALEGADVSWRKVIELIDDANAQDERGFA